MTAQEAIRSRRSVRTFDGNGLGEEESRKILEFADQAVNPYGIPISWRIPEGMKYIATYLLN